MNPAKFLQKPYREDTYGLVFIFNDGDGQPIDIVNTWDEVVLRVFASGRESNPAFTLSLDDGFTLTDTNTLTGEYTPARTTQIFGGAYYYELRVTAGTREETLLADRVVVRGVKDGTGQEESAIEFFIDLTTYEVTFQIADSAALALQAAETAIQAANVKDRDFSAILPSLGNIGFQYDTGEFERITGDVLFKGMGIVPAESYITPDTGSGISEDLQSLINDIGSTGGGVIYFKNGEYLIDQEINIPIGVNFLLADSAVIRSELNGRMFIYNAGFQIKGGTIDGNRDNFTCQGFYPVTHGRRYFGARDITFQNFGDYCWVINEGAAFEFSQCHFQDSDNYAFWEAGGLDGGAGDKPRYGRYKACTTRACKGFSHATAGSRYCRYDIRMLDTAEHHFLIEGQCEQNEYQGNWRTANGSAIYSTSNFIDCTFSMHVANNCIDPPDTYNEDAAQIYIDTSMRSSLFLNNGQCTNSEHVADVAFHDVQNTCSIISASYTAHGVWKGGRYTILMSQRWNNATIESTSAFIINTRPFGQEQPYIEDHDGNKMYLGILHHVVATDDVNFDPIRQILRADTSSNPITVTLPDASEMGGLTATIMKWNTGGDLVTISSTSLIRSNILTLSEQYESVSLRSDGASWWKV